MNKLDQWEKIEKEAMKIVKRVQNATKNNKGVKLSNEECKILCLTFFDNIDRDY